MKNADDSIGNSTRDLPACSAFPQPIACIPQFYNMWQLNVKEGMTQIKELNFPSLNKERVVMCTQSTSKNYRNTDTGVEAWPPYLRQEHKENFTEALDILW